MKYALCSVAALAGVCTPPVLAQETVVLKEIVLSNSLTPVERAHSGASVEVLTGEDTGQDDTSVIERLDRLPGVNSTTNGGLGGQSAIQIRGLPARYVGVRINGIDVSDPSIVQNQFNFGGLTAGCFARVEVLKGAQSALYGSEAIAGLVDITTYRPTKLGFSAVTSIELGSFNTYSAALNMGHRGERGEVALSYARLTTDGISARAGDAEKDGFKQTTLSFTVEHEVAENVTLGGAIFYRDGESEIDRSAADNTGTNSFEERGIRGYARFATGVVTHDLSYSHFDVVRKDPGGFTTRFKGERRTLAYLGSAELGESTVLNFGIDHTEEKYSDASFIRGTEDTTALQTELLFRPLDTVDISAALRYDDNSDFGGHTTGRLTGAWRPVENLVIRAMAATGFRAPSLYERFSGYGDPTLRPEESRSLELGIEKTFNDLGFIKATLFYNEIDGLINFDPAAAACGSGFGCYNQVPGTTKSKGIELSGEYALGGRVTAYGSYTYTDARTKGARLVRTPRHDVSLGMRADFTRRMSGYFDLRHVADVVPDAYAPATHKVGDYTLVGAGVSYDMNDNTQAYLRIENLFDEDYETAGGYNMPGRAAYFGVRANF